MRTASARGLRLGLGFLLSLGCLQPRAAVAAAGDGGKWLDVDFPRDSPVLPVSFSLRPTTARAVGTSLALDLHASLLLRNTTMKTVSGLTLRVEAQDLTPSGRGSVTIPSIEAQPGEVFPVRIDLELTRPFAYGQGEGAMVRVSLDCALFGDLTAYGPDQLKSRRSLLVFEMEARRDRQHLAGLLAARQWAAIREELNFGLQDLYPPPFGLELLRNTLGDGHEREMAVRPMAFASSPVLAMAGEAQVAGNEIRDPHIVVRNTSKRMVRSVDVGWVVRDDRGKAFVAGLVAAPIRLAPVETGNAGSLGTLRLSRVAGQDLAVAGLLAYVSDVEFADGQLWIPSRDDIDQATPDPMLRRVLANSPEQQRLSQVWRRRGIGGLTEELKAGSDRVH